MDKTLDYYMGLPYTVEVRHDPQSATPWFAKVVELPGCMTEAATFEELGPMVEDAKRGWLEVSLEHGDPIPEPRDPEGGSRWDAPPCEMNRIVRIPEAVPELGVEPGDSGVIDCAHDLGDGKLLLNVEVPKDGGVSAGFLDVEVLPEGSLRVVGYSRLSTWPPGPDGR